MWNGLRSASVRTTRRYSTGCALYTKIVVPATENSTPVEVA